MELIENVLDQTSERNTRRNAGARKLGWQKITYHLRLPKTDEPAAVSVKQLLRRQQFSVLFQDPLTFKKVTSMTAHHDPSLDPAPIPCPEPPATAPSTAKPPGHDESVAALKRHFERSSTHRANVTCCGGGCQNAGASTDSPDVTLECSAVPSGGGAECIATVGTEADEDAPAIGVLNEDPAVADRLGEAGSFF